MLRDKLRAFVSCISPPLDSFQGEFPYKNDRGAHWKRTPKRYQDPVLWAQLERFFSPLRGTNSFITYYLLSYVFASTPPKGTTKAVDFLRLNILKGAKAAFLTPKRYVEHNAPSTFFLWEFPPLPRRHAAACYLNSGSN